MKEITPEGLPPLRALQAFEAVARLGSISRAAQALGVSSGAISQQLRVLEGAVGFALMERSGRGIVPTAWGRRYLPNVAAGFEALRAAQEVARRLKLNRQILVSAPPSVSARWLGARLFEWGKLHPKIEVQLQSENSEPDLQAGDADFRITYGDLVRKHGHSVALFTDTVVVAISPELLRRRTLRNPKDILDYPLISIEWEPWIDAPPPSWAAWLTNQGVLATPPRPAMVFSLASAAIDAAANGRGAVLAQLSMIEDELRTGRLTSPFPEATLPLPKPYFLAWSASSLTKRGCRDLQRWLINSQRRP